MKLVTFLDQREGPERRALPALGAVDAAGRIVDLQAAQRAVDGAASPLLESLQAWLEGGAAAADLAAQRIGDAPPSARLAANDARLLAPLPRPASLRDCMSFEQHVVQCTRTVVGWRAPPLAWLDRRIARWRGGRSLLAPPPVWYERPLYYKGNPRSVVGPDAEVRAPRGCRRFDFELEVAAVIGAAGRDVSVAEAPGHIAGYMIFNDFSARDLQLREMQGRLGPAKGKDFDTGNSLGPWLVTPDELPDPADGWAMEARVNGDVWCAASTSELHFSFPEMIAFVSRDETLYPGDLIGSGTAPGGCGLEHDRYLHDGDLVELQIAGLGSLRNPVSLGRAN